MVRAMNGRPAQQARADMARRVGPDPNTARPRKKSRFSVIVDNSVPADTEPDATTLTELNAAATYEDVDLAPMPSNSNVPESVEQEKLIDCRDSGDPATVTTDEPTGTPPPTEKFVFVIDRTQYEIDGVVLGSGMTAGTQQLEKGTWYGCQTSVSDAMSYFEIEHRSLTAPDCGARPVSFPTKVLDASISDAPGECTLSNRRALRCVALDRGANHFVVEKILKFCKQNPGVAVITGRCPGSRQPNPALVQYSDPRCSDVIQMGGRLDCVPSSIVHAVQYFRGKAGVKVAMEKLLQSNGKPSNLGQVGGMVQSLGLKLALRKPASRQELH